MTVEVDDSLRAMKDFLPRVPGAGAFAQRLAGVGDRALTGTGAQAAAAFAAGIDWTARATAATAQAVAAFMRGRGACEWIVPYDGDPRSGRGFGERSAFCMIVGPEGRGHRSDFSAGFFIVGPDVDYNDHRHGPAELYLPMAGIAQFWTESGGWHDVGPGTAIVHPEWEWHAMRTGASPVLIFWAWISEETEFVMPELRAALGGAPV